VKVRTFEEEIVAASFSNEAEGHDDWSALSVIVRVELQRPRSL
jgi:hypothetical protein